MIGGPESSNGHKIAKIPPPNPIPSNVIPPTTTALHWNGTGPAPPALFLLLLLLLLVAVLVPVNPFAALNPVAVGL